MVPLEELVAVAVAEAAVAVAAAPAPVVVVVFWATWEVGRMRLSRDRRESSRKNDEE